MMMQISGDTGAFQRPKAIGIGFVNASIRATFPVNAICLIIVGREVTPRLKTLAVRLIVRVFALETCEYNLGNVSSS